MRAQQLFTVFAFLMGAGLGGPWTGAYGQDYEEYPLETRVWMDRGHEPVLQRGESVRLYYRVSEDAFVTIFHIDTNGTARMVFPTSPQENHFARGGRDYRVLFPGATHWYVNDDPGMGYFFAVASPEPFDFSDLRYSHYDGGWDLSFVGRQVYRDPYLAMDDYVAALIPDWEYLPYGLDFTAYHVEQRYDYPRFMCYDCHGFRPYNVWNPYHYSCASFRVVVYDDPYYYPVSRYRGTRVVYLQPRRGVAHFGFKERAAGESGTPKIVVRGSPGGSQPGVAGTEIRRAQPRSGDPSDRAVPSAGTAVRRNPASTGTGAPSGVARRPSGGGVTRLIPPSASGAGARRGGTPETVPLTAPRTGTGSVRGEVQRITDPARPRATTPPGAATNRPVLERRPTNGSTTAPGARPSTGGKTITRPSAKVRKGGGSGGTGGTGIPSSVGTGVSRDPGSQPSAGSGGSPSRAIRPTVRSGGSSTSSSRPDVRNGGSSAQTIRPTVRSGGNGAQSTRPTVRSGGNGAQTTRPTVRSGGNGAQSTRPTVRSGGNGAQTTRPTVRSGGNGAQTTRPTVRSGGSGTRSSPPAVRSTGGSRTSPPATTRRPPVRKKKNGGGGI